MGRLLPWLEEGRHEAGCDEAGRGCLAGPVVAAAVILPGEMPDELADGLNDSKKLSPATRDRLQRLIRQYALSWAVSFVYQHEIDQMNILKASIHAMHLAIEALILQPDYLLIDGNRFAPYPGISHSCIVRGDALFMSVAAAGILAKTTRDAFMKEMHRQYPVYGWDKNKAYPTAFHRQALQDHGPSPLHRMSFLKKIII